MSSEPTDRILTVPNLITLVRLLLVPVSFALLVVYRNDVAAFVVFLIAASTDFVDGMLARSTGQVSKLGQQLDPLVDRFLIIAGVIGVFMVGRVPLWILLVLILRDIAMGLLTIYMLRVHNRRFEVVFLGKLTTALVMAGFCMLMLNWPLVPGAAIVNAGFLPGWGDVPASFGIWLLYVGTVISVVTAAIYVRMGTMPSTDDSTAKDAKMTLAQCIAAQTAAAQETGHIEPLGGRNRRQAASGRTQAARAARGTAGRRFRAGQAATQQLGGMAGGQQDLRLSAAYGSTGGTSRRRVRGQVGSHSAARPAAKSSRNPASKNGGTAASSRRNARLPFKLPAVILICVLAAGIAFYTFDNAHNWNTVHPGVRAAGIDLGYLTRDDAAAVLDSELSRRMHAEPVDIFASQEAKSAGINSETIHYESGVISYDATSDDRDEDAPASSWRVSASSLGLSVDAEKAASDAFAIGRGADFLLGRLLASTLGCQIDVGLSCTGTQLAMLEEDITASVGWPMVNSDISLGESGFAAVEGKDGYVVDSAAFLKQLNGAFFGSEHELVVPMTTKRQEISLEQAGKAAALAESCTQTPVELVFEGKSYPVPADTLRGWVASAVERDDAGAASIVVVFAPERIKADISDVIGGLNPGTAPVEAHYIEVDGALQVVPGKQGQGIDFAALAASLGESLFGSGSGSGSGSGGMAQQGTGQVAGGGEAAQVSITIPIGPIDPQLTTAMALSYSFPEKIEEFTTYYWGSTNSRINNVHQAAFYANCSVIEPGATWSFNERVGECTLERGFQMDQAVVGDTYEDAIGGGVCQVASTIFNAVFDAGLPILERSNHAIYLGNYPDGRDAAIAWPYADLKFKNDTTSRIVLIMSYDDASVTAALWGVDPGYIVESQATPWKDGDKFSTKEVANPDLPEGERVVKIAGRDGRSISVTRKVYNPDGSKHLEGTFHSTYNSRTELVEVGTG